MTIPSPLPRLRFDDIEIDAFDDPRRWPQIRAVIERTERALSENTVLVPYDFTRFMLPERDFERDVAGLDAIQRAGYATYNWLFWMPSERAVRQSPAFQTYLRESGLLAFWREHGWPDLCRSDGGDGVVCD